MINNKFLIFKTQEGFKKKSSQIPQDSIVFIKDKGAIWTHGQYFGLSTQGIEKGKGYFNSVEDLKRQYPSPQVGDWAIVGSATVEGQESQWVIASCTINGVWDLTAQTYDQQYFDVDAYVKKEDLDLSKYIMESDLYSYAKTSDVQFTYLTKNEFYQQIQQLMAASASNSITVDSQLSTTSENPVQNKVINAALANKLEESDLEEYAKTSDIRTLINNRILEILDQLQDNDGEYSVREEIINERIDELKALIDDINEKYISWGVNEGGSSGQNDPSGNNPYNASNMITLSEEDYQALVESNAVDPNTYYFTYNAADYPSENTWTFGNQFPVIFSEQQWTFGGTFPIILQ